MFEDEEDDVEGELEEMAEAEEDEPIPGQLQQFPAIWSEEGKYLASVLGDALVKGLTQVSHDRPPDPVEYLANFLKKYHQDGTPIEEESQLLETGEEMESALPGTPLPQNPVVKTSTLTKDIKFKNLDIDGVTVVPAVRVDKSESVVEKDAEVEEVNIEEPGSDETSEAQLDKLEEEAYNDLEAGEGEDPDEQDENEIRRADDVAEAADNSQSGTRDDRGQSVLHFAAARPGGASTILAFLQNPSVNLAWRDERLRTARDIGSGMSRQENIRTIDSWIISLAVAGDKESLQNLLLDGYDHITDVGDLGGNHVIDLAEKAGKREVALFLRSIPDFMERLEKVHQSVRKGEMEFVKNLLMRDSRLALALSPLGRTALHVAVLVEEYNIVRFICEHFPDCLKRGDNIERTPLHYAMGVEKVEKMTRVLVRNGAKRVVKDLRGRQPSYYFINREEIALLQREEEDLSRSNT